MKRTSAILMLLCCSIVSTVSAQTGWLPRSVDMGPNLKGANRATALARLEAIERLVKHVPELAHPVGFEITTHFTGHRSRLGLGDSDHPDYVIEYILRLTFFAPKWVEYGDPAGEVIFTINADESESGWLDPQGRGIYIEPSRWPRAPFSSVTYGESDSGTLQANDPFYAAVWLTPGGELPWRAVSREDYYTASIASAEGNNGEKRATYTKATEKTGYERWREEAPQRKKEREEILKAVAQLSPPAEVAKLRKTLEDAEREAGEEFKKNESAEREDAKTAFASTDTMRAELNRMTPAQRKLPAIVDADPARTEWRATGASMRDRDTLLSTVHRVLTPNYDFWRARQSPVDVRLIRVYFRARNSPPPVILNAVYQTYKKLDWRALAALLDQPTRE